MTVVCRRGLSWSRIWRSLKRTWLQLAGSLGQSQARLIHFHLLQPSSPPSSSCPPSSSSLWPPTAQFLCLLQPNMCCCEIVELRRRCNFCCDFAVSFREKLKAIFTRGPTLGRDESSSGSVFNSQKKYIWRIDHHWMQIRHLVEKRHYRISCRDFQQTGAFKILALPLTPKYGLWYSQDFESGC